MTSESGKLEELNTDGTVTLPGGQTVKVKK